MGGPKKSAVCQENYPHRARLRALTHRLETSRITPPGGIKQFFIEVLDTPAGLFSWEGLAAIWRLSFENTLSRWQS